MICTVKVEVTNPETSQQEVWELEADCVPSTPARRHGHIDDWDDGDPGSIDFIRLRREGVEMDYDEFMAKYVVDGSTVDQWYELLGEQCNTEDDYEPDYDF